MIRVYFLPVTTESGVDTVAGHAVMHDAILACAESPNVRCLTMNTTVTEHAVLASLALTWRDASPDEIDRFTAQVIITPPNSDIARAQKILHMSSGNINNPEQTELIRILFRLHGITA